RNEVTYVARHDRVWPVLRDFSEGALILGRCRLLEQHRDHRHLQSLACFLKRSLKRLGIGTFPPLARRQPRDLGYRRDGLLEDLKALRVEFGVIEADPGDVAAGVRKTGHKPNPDRFDPYPNHWDCAGLRADRQRNRVGDGNNHVRVAADDTANEIRIPFRASLAGIPLDCKVLSLDIAKPAELFEKSLVEPATQGVATSFADESDGTGGDDD